MRDEREPTRRGVMGSVLMGVGLVAAYGTLGVQALTYLLPRRLQAKTRLIFAGRVDEFPVGGVRTVRDLQGTPVLVKRVESGFTAFDSTCPHLGCKVHWEPDNKRFFCPCHNGEFDADGVAYAGPPGDAGQSLEKVGLEVNEEAGVVYLEVKDPGRST